jgi:Zn finger protein HypA/HybF involved in hydrogenase expression
MIAECKCQNCGGSIEFDADSLDRSGATSHRVLGQMVECPHCHQQTQLYLNLATFAAPKNQTTPPEKQPRLIACDDCGTSISRDAAFCPNCGKFHVWKAAGSVCFAMGVFSLVGWGILKLIDLIFGNG